MARSPTSAERAALAQAHEARTAARAALDAAEDAHRLAQRDYDGARGDLMEIEAQVQRLKAVRTHGLPHLIETTNEQLSICYSKMDAAERTVGPLGDAAHAAQARVDAARIPVANADLRIAQAARRVVASEVEPLARAHVARLLDAFATILRVGPDVLAMRDMLPPELVSEIESAAGRMLPRATAWEAFEARRNASPWRSAVALLEQDPQAPLPS